MDVAAAMASTAGSECAWEAEGIDMASFDRLFVMSFIITVDGRVVKPSVTNNNSEVATIANGICVMLLFMLYLSLRFITLKSQVDPYRTLDKNQCVRARSKSGGVSPPSILT